MNAVEKKIRMITATLTNAQTVEDVAETINRIAVNMDGYSTEVNSYLKGLYEYVDSNDGAFHPLTDEQKFAAQNIGARLLLNREDIVTALVRLHHMLGWTDGESAMIALTDKLYSIAESVGIPSVKYED